MAPHIRVHLAHSYVHRFSTREQFDELGDAFVLNPRGLRAHERARTRGLKHVDEFFAVQ